MVLLQPRLHLKVSQRQILTPGLVQMVSVLALNKLELRDMINTEMVENPVLEELEDAVPLLDDVDRKQETRDQPAVEESPTAAADKKDPFEEIDFGSFFQDYLDPGYRSQRESEEVERPSFENFLSKPSNLTDHLTWQLGSIPTRPEVREAAEQIIGNLNEDGYLIASDEELLGVTPPAPPGADAAAAESLVKEAAALGLSSPKKPPPSRVPLTLCQNQAPTVSLLPQSNGVISDRTVPAPWGPLLLRLPQQLNWLVNRLRSLPRLPLPGLNSVQISISPICTKPSKLCVSWILLASPAATYASACSTSCASTSNSSNRRRMGMASAKLPRRCSAMPLRSSTSTSARCRTSRSKKSAGP